MFGIGEKTLKERVNEVDLTMSNDLQMIKPRYEYTVKIFEEGENGKPITSIQKGVKAPSDQDLYALYAIADQKIQILEKREINPPDDNQTPQPPPQQQMVQQMGMSLPQPRPQMPMPPPQKPAEPQVRYFSGGGVDFKIVGDDVYQKQWIRATENDCKKIRIINDSNNKIVELKDKHIELLTWVKVESSTDKDTN